MRIDQSQVSVKATTSDYLGIIGQGEGMLRRLCHFKISVILSIYCPSFSKVNIGLKVLKQRDDGYHNIYTLFQKLDFGDELILEKMENSCLITSNVDWIPTDKSNICYKAYNVLKTLYLI
ncbi:MAG: hypothetical protein Ct9H300mP29_1080 [Candidatus Neomarinimicrobiota bacterium]|nr:MAG: hypothetical protein Ct9H300mP29_1080 [Candidatus Neomarinimicrobiota bacterium]